MKPSEEYKIVPQLSLEERISRRSELTLEKTEALLNADFDDKEKYFFNEVSNNEEVWTLWESGQLMEFSLANNVWGVCAWPNEVFVRKFAITLGLESYDVVPIPINDFLDEVIFNQNPASDVIIFPIEVNAKSNVCSAEVFAEKLSNTSRRMIPPPRW